MLTFNHLRIIVILIYFVLILIGLSVRKWKKIRLTRNSYIDILMTSSECCGVLFFLIYLIDYGVSNRISQEMKAIIDALTIFVIFVFMLLLYQYYRAVVKKR